MDFDLILVGFGLDFDSILAGFGFHSLGFGLILL